MISKCLSVPSSSPYCHLADMRRFNPCGVPVHNWLLLQVALFKIMSSKVKLLQLRLLIDKNTKVARMTKDYSQRRRHITLDNFTEVFRDPDFALAYHMKRSTFRKLLFLVKARLCHDDRIGSVAKRPVVTPEIRLAVCIRMMASGSVHDSCTTFQLARSTVYSIFKDTRKELNDALSLPGIPTTFHGPKKMSEDFQSSRASANPLPGCIEALDGISIAIKKPTDREQPATYYCRKGFYALPVQAMCDSNYRFRCFSATCVRSTHDSLLHAISALGRYLEQGGLREQFWIASDEAYVCSTCLITPVTATQATDHEDAFNFYHTSSRMHIERAFGMLVQKWLLLKRLENSVSDLAEIVGLAMKLHNFCIDHDGSMQFVRQQSEEHRKAIQESEDWFAKGKNDYAVQVSRPGFAKRNHLIDIIKQGGFRRPPIRTMRVPAYLRVSHPY